ncbi:MAG: peroxidase-related enzyme [Pseudonocardia sp.]|nr:peroxidase-related enzyme [Pseudonocardia sp.]
MCCSCTRGRPCPCRTSPRPNSWPPPCSTTSSTDPRARRPSGSTPWRPTSPRSCPRRPPRPSTHAPLTRCGPTIPSGTPRPSTGSSGRTLLSATSSARPTCSPGWARTRSPGPGRPPTTAHRSARASPGSRRPSCSSPRCRRRTGRTSWWSSTLTPPGRTVHCSVPPLRGCWPWPPRGPAQAEPPCSACCTGRPRWSSAVDRPRSRVGSSLLPLVRGRFPHRADRSSRPGPDRRASHFPDVRRSPNVATVTQNRTDDHPVSRFGHVEPADLPDDLRERIEAIAEKSGFVPNVFRALARRPAELRAFLDYHDALMERAGGLSKAERELVVVATSGVNHCVYCVVAHGAILRIRAKDAEIADRVATNPWTAPLTPRERAIVDLALVLATEPARLSVEHLDAARAAGLDDDEVWDVGAITALFALSNRMAHLTALQPNPEFFLMGRG